MLLLSYTVDILTNLYSKQLYFLVYAELVHRDNFKCHFIIFERQKRLKIGSQQVIITMMNSTYKLQIFYLQMLQGFQFMLVCVFIILIFDLTVTNFCRCHVPCSTLMLSPNSLSPTYSLIYLRIVRLC